MGTKIQWTCDGCNAEALSAISERPSDWHHIRIEISGFTGYPVGAHENGVKSYDLCPDCQVLMANAMKPRKRPLAAEAFGQKGVPQ